HREKYVDVPVGQNRAFVFEGDGRASERRARTLRQFVAKLEAGSNGAFDGHLARGDFSRWIADVFGDHALAAELERLEARHREGPRRDTVSEIAAAVRARYDLAADEQA